MKLILCENSNISSNKSILSKKKLGIKIYPQIAKCLSSLEKSTVFTPKEFIAKHARDFTKNGQANPKRTRDLIPSAISVGKKLGMIEQSKLNLMSFEEFLELETIQYFRQQLKGEKRKHLKSNSVRKTGNSTEYQYTYQLWKFSNWLYGKQFEFTYQKQIDIETFKMITEKVTIQHVEHFLKLYQKATGKESDFIRVIKRYLLSDFNSKKKATTLNIIKSALKAYFGKNDSYIVFKFDSSISHELVSDTNSELSLNDIFKILTVGKPSITEKAVILCKFHRGLDNSTLADRFSFEAWSQLVK